jgi:hypothetical protein
MRDTGQDVRRMEQPMFDVLLAMTMCAALAVVTWTVIEIERHLL